MPVAAAIIPAVAGIAGAAISSSSASKASKSAATATTQANDKAIAEQRRQFDQTQALLQPWIAAGSPALKAQMDFLGLNGAPAQQAAVSAQEQSPFFQSLVARGEDAILQNASATGGLRGGNVQGALSQFRPELLNSFITQQYNRLGGIAALGQNAAAGVGNLGQATANNVSGLLQSNGAAQAGGILGAAQAQQTLFNGISQGIGSLAGIAQQGVFGGFGGNSGYNAALAQTNLVTPRGF